MEQKPQDAIIEQYKTIQALTPSDESVEVSDAPSIPISTFLSLSLFIFFFVVVFLGFLPLLVERFRNFRRFQSALLLALISASLPLTLGMLLQRGGLMTRAYVEEIPQQVQIKDVTSTSFSVKWQTEGEHYGSLRYGTQAVISELTDTALEVDGLLRKQHHEVLVDGLQPQTDYYFQILSGTRWYDENGAMLSVKTLP